MRKAKVELPQLHKTAFDYLGGEVLAAKAVASLIVLLNPLLPDAANGTIVFQFFYLRSSFPIPSTLLTLKAEYDTNGI